MGCEAVDCGWWDDWVATWTMAMVVGGGDREAMASKRPENEPDQGPVDRVSYDM